MSKFILFMIITATVVIVIAAYKAAKGDDMENLVKALKCTTLLPGEREMKCEDCRYYGLEEIVETEGKLYPPIEADVIIDGKKYWRSCDFDRIALDAADTIKEYAGIEK